MTQADVGNGLCRACRLSLSAARPTMRPGSSHRATPPTVCRRRPPPCMAWQPPLLSSTSSLPSPFSQRPLDSQVGRSQGHHLHPARCLSPFFSSPPRQSGGVCAASWCLGLPTAILLLQIVGCSYSSHLLFLLVRPASLSFPELGHCG